ncbi:MAG: DEAD/DEAH box helicase [Parachlamydiaceae bacterium]
MSNFAHFNLEEKILKVLKDINYETPTAIQAAAIPKVLSGQDLIASAQTGTGKTGAFMLPILNILAQNPLEKDQRPKALILVPTRELALQVAEETKKYSKYLSYIRAVCIYGGVPYPIQKRSLSSHYDILIATPGRLIDHIEQKRIDLSSVKVLVLDEADRMLDMGFIDAVEQITRYLPKERQTLLFSATIDNKILPISKKLQKNPFEIRVKQDLSLKENIDASLYYVDDIHHKMRLLDHFLETVQMTQMIVFTSTINQTKALANYLQENDYLAGALHGDMDQRQRTKTISRLRKGIIQILVATDVAARGIDIASLSHVINFDLPFQSEDFVHRIGRTGRAGAKGSAITFATYKEDHFLERIYRLIGKPLPILTIEGLEPKPRDRQNTQPRQRRSLRTERNRFTGKSTFGQRRGQPRDKRASFREDKEKFSYQKEGPTFSKVANKAYSEKQPFFAKAKKSDSAERNPSSFRKETRGASFKDKEKKFAKKEQTKNFPLHRSYAEKKHRDRKA